MTSQSSSVQDTQIFSAWWFLLVGSSAHVPPNGESERLGDKGTKCDELINRNDWNDFFDF